MPVYAHESDLPVNPSTGHRSGRLIHEAHGAVNGYCIGIGYYDKEEYGQPGIHEDQEGFYVLEGTGTAKIGDEEFKIRPGTAFIAARRVPHAIKKDPDSPPVKVLWSHGAV